jgi:hypothetical protein
MEIYKEIKDELLKLYSSVNMLEKLVDLTTTNSRRLHKKKTIRFKTGKSNNCKKNGRGEYK